VDGVVVHSGCFEDHLRHLETVLEKLITAGFKINANKCSFCKPEVKFWGHVISREALMPDMDRVKFFLSYAPFRNQKQLSRFLAICNFHQQFMPNYAHFGSPLLILLKRGHKWKWTGGLQKAFELLRDRFAHSIELVHPDSESECAIYTDASARAIVGSANAERQSGKFKIYFHHFTSIESNRTRIHAVRARIIGYSPLTPKV